MSRAPQPPPETLLAHAGWVRALARRLLRDQAAAEDLAQQALAVALESGPRQADSWRAWLGTVVRRGAWKEHAALAARARREQQAAAAEAQPSAAEVVARAEALRRVVDAVMALPEPYRTVVLLRYFEERAPRRIARQLGASDEAVRSQLKRGLELLRKRLGASHGPDWRASCALLAAPLAGAGYGQAWSAVERWGEFVMSTKTTVAAGATVLALAAIWWWPGRGGDSGRAERPQDAAAAAAEMPAAGEWAAAPAPAAGPAAAGETEIRHEVAADGAPAGGDGLGLAGTSPVLLFGGHVQFQNGRSLPPGTRARAVAWKPESGDLGYACEQETYPDSGGFWMNIEIDPLRQPDGSFYRDWTLFASTPDGAQARLDLPEVELGQDYSALILSLEAVPYCGGRVVLADGSGRAIPGAQVELWGARNGSALRPSATSTITRGDGAFELSLPEGRSALGLRVHADGLPPFYLPAERLAEVRPSAFLLLEIPVAAAIEGLVLDADGRPAPPGTVVEWRPRDYAWLPDAARNTACADDGTFQLFDLAPGSGTLSLQHQAQVDGRSSLLLSRIASAEAPLTLLPGQTAYAHLSLPRACALRGRIDFGGQDVDGWEVVFLDPRGREWGAASAAADGSFVIAAPEGARGYLFARARGPVQQVHAIGAALKAMWVEQEAARAKEVRLSPIEVAVDGGSIRRDARKVRLYELKKSPPRVVGEPFSAVAEWGFLEYGGQEATELHCAWLAEVTAPAEDLRLAPAAGELLVRMPPLRRDNRPLRAVLRPLGHPIATALWPREGLEFASDSLPREYRVRGLPPGRYALAVYDRHGRVLEHKLELGDGRHEADLEALIGKR